MNPVQALEETVRQEAAPITSTSMALIAGLAVLALSGFPPVAHFGWLSALVMFAALATTFLVTPLLLSSVRLVSLWDMLDLKLRKRVRERCLLFQGMRTWQIKKLILMSEIRDFGVGETLYRQGDQGSEMFIVLE